MLKMLDLHDDGGGVGGSGTADAPHTGAPTGFTPVSSRKHLKVMIAGDSMTHGNEGDYTWRFRLWEWFKNAAPNTKMEYVGPKLGTVPPADPEPPQPPRLSDEPEPPDRDVFTGGYALDIPKEFKGYHFSQTGRAVWQAKDWIEDVVKQYQPDLLLVMLGFNDMSWCVTGPEDTFKNMKTFISKARTAKPDVNFVIGNVPQRPPTETHKDLFVWTSRYNSFLHTDLPELSTKSSRIELAEIERVYGYIPDSCKGTYDSIHPNSLGDYQIARAFSVPLHDRYGIGKEALRMPDRIPPRALPKPKNPEARGVSYGIRFTFDAVYGSIGYDMRKRSKGAKEWSESPSMVNRLDDSWASEGAEFEFQARARHGDDEKGEWSDVASGTAQKHVAPPPKNGKVRPLPTGFEATWEPLDDPQWDVDRYAVLYADQAGGFLCAKGARGTIARVEDLEPGHTFNILLQTWTFEEGPGTMTGVGTVVVGSNDSS